MCLGVVMIYSAGSRVDREPQWFMRLSDPASKQLMFAMVAFVVLLFMADMDYGRFRYGGSVVRWPGTYLLLAAVLLLGLVYVPVVGQEVNGARRWIRLGPVTFQPSEFAKYVLVVFLAGVLAHARYPRRKFLIGLLPLCAAIGLLCGLVVVEDLGTAALMALVAAMLLVAGGARLWQMLILALPGVAGFVYMVIKTPYRVERITSFMDIWKDPQGSGYHAIQSLVAIGNGSWWGVGLGKGIQKYGFLPEDTTDFIFSIICEEVGLAGALLVMGLIAAIVWSGLAVYRRCGDDFGKLLTFGVVATIGLQAAINIAVATVSVPTKGIALPFVSAGGSGLIVAAAALGLVCSVAQKPKT